jgi:hypothetical protein
MLARMWGKRNPYLLLVGMQITSNTMKAEWRFLKK